MHGVRPLQRLALFLLISSSLPLLSCAYATSSWRTHGIIGYGINMYSPGCGPGCGFACHHVLSQSSLNYSVPPVTDRWHGGSSLGFYTSPECFASDDTFLLSMACCLQQGCGAEDGLEDWVIERYWEQHIVGEDLKPKYKYSEALRMCIEGLQYILVSGEPLEFPSKVAVEDWAVAKTSMRDFALNEVILELIKFLTFSISTKAERPLLAYLIHPPMLQKRHLIFRLLGEAQPPTCGQALLILFIVILNLMFSILGYHGSMPNIYWKSNINMTVDTLANRVGILSFANLPVIFIYSSRNNPLIRITGWPYATFIQLHRWVAHICVSQAMLHSIIYFIVHIPVLSHKFAQSYWNLGILGTTTFCLILPTSILFVRRNWYDLFVDTHVTLALTIVLACYYHIYYKFEHNWGYENWVLLAIMVWALERFMRGFSIATNGVRTAIVLEVDEEYFVINIEGVKGTGIAYLYFPTLGWRSWENHPFSIMASIVEAQGGTVGNTIEEGDTVFGLIGSDSDSDSYYGFELANGAEAGLSRNTLDKQLCSDQSPIPMTPITPHSASFMISSSSDEDEEREIICIKRRKIVTGLSFLIRREKGTTSRLFTESLRLPVFVEGPYPSHLSLTSLATVVPYLICIAGGVGIAPTLPVLRTRVTASVGSTRLYFGTRSRGLLSTCGLEELQRKSTDLDIKVRVQERWDLEELVWNEAGCCEPGSNGYGAEILIVVCGPATMVEGIRMAVVEANKRCRHGIVRPLDDSFS